MKVTILGAGVGALHYLPSANLNKYPPAFLIQWGNDEKLLLECSQGVDQRLEQAGFDYASIHHVAISHPHADHCVPIPFIQSVYLKGLWGGEQFKNKELSLYGPDDLIKNIPILWNIYFPNQDGKYFDWPALRLIPMSQGDLVYSIGSATLAAKKVFHGAGKCDAVSYRLETPEGIIAYSGDTGDCDGIREVAKNADLFICEASARISDFETQKNYGHLTPFTIGEIAKEAHVKKIILFHYTGHDSDEAMITDLKKSGFTGEIIAGKDFQEISI